MKDLFDAEYEFFRVEVRFVQQVEALKQRRAVVRRVKEMRQVKQLYLSPELSG